MITETIEITGHIVDSLTLPKVLDQILATGGDYVIDEIRIGKHRRDTSYARIQVSAKTPDQLEQITKEIQKHGAAIVRVEEARLARATKNGIFPQGFYSTTNMETYAHVGGRWLPVRDIEMDCGIVVDAKRRRARCVPMADVKRGQLFVVGHRGVRVHTLERPEPDEAFAFMSAEISSERAKTRLIAETAREIKRVRAAGKKVLFVGGPAIIHTGSGPHLEAIVRRGWIDVLFAGNALATHDIEQALYGTSLGVHLDAGHVVEHGHEHHLRAINTIRACGGIAAAVRQKVLTRGVMYQCIQQGVPFVLAGSIRDDGPLPEVITDVLEAQRAMRKAIKGVGIAICVATMLHSIATGNLLPAAVKTICVDINPAVVTKLADRGSFQAVGIVTDTEPFLRELARRLKGRATRRKK